MSVRIHYALRVCACRAVLYCSDSQGAMLNLDICGPASIMPRPSTATSQNGWQAGHPEIRIDLDDAAGEVFELALQEPGAWCKRPRSHSLARWPLMSACTSENWWPELHARICSCAMKQPVSRSERDLLWKDSVSDAMHVS